MRHYTAICAFLLCVACQGDADSTAADAGQGDAEVIECDSKDPVWGPGGALMLAGTDCLECHSDGGRAASAPLTVAGTVFRTGDCATASDATKIFIVDANSIELELQSNQAGNFFTSEPLAFPLQVSIERDGVRATMQTPVTSGACATCHAPEQLQGDYLRIQ